MQDKIREIAGKIWYNTQTYGEVLQELEDLVKIIQQDLECQIVAKKQRRKKVDKR